MIVRGSAETLKDLGEHEVFVVFNAGHAREVILPPGDWVRILDSANPDSDEKPVSDAYKAAEQSVVLFAHPDATTQEGS